MRATLPILALLLATPAAAQPPATTAEEVIAEARRSILLVLDFDLRSTCRSTPREDPDEIVVCGGRDEVTESQRLGEFPEEPQVPTFTGRRGHASAFEESACTHRCMPQPQIDVFRAVNTIRRGIGRLFDRD